MMKKQFRKRDFACLNSDMVGGFPPYTIGGVPVPNHSVCEVLDDDTLRVVAVYKLHDGQWYRYDLVAIWPPYPPQPEPLQKTISLGLVVPGMPVIPDSTGGGLPTGVQHWAAYPDSPDLLDDYPYQCVCLQNYNLRLYTSNKKMYRSMDENLRTAEGGAVIRMFYKPASSWVFLIEYDCPNVGDASNSASPFYESNFNVYNAAVGGDLVFAQTTPPTSQPNPNATVLSPSPVAISRPAIAVPTMPTITEATT